MFDAENGVEHLRFDDLDDNKHYHYLRADGSGLVVWFDPVANGDFLTWVFDTLSEKAGPMLALAGVPELAAKVDLATVRSTVDEVRRAAAAQLEAARS